MSELAYNPHQYAYTDRNVREDPRLRRIAEEYVYKYGGSFDPLVDAQKYFYEHGELTVAIVRKVLNCMRSDGSVAHLLPRPDSPVVVNIADAPSVQQRAEEKVARAKSREPEEKMCKRSPSPHEPHPYEYFNGRYYYRCPGIPWLINRKEEVTLPLKVNINFPYVKGPSGRLIHAASRTGHTVTWTLARTFVHTMKLRRLGGWIIKVECERGGKQNQMSRGRLLQRKDVELLLKNDLARLCPNCFEGA